MLADFAFCIGICIFIITAFVINLTFFIIKLINEGFTNQVFVIMLPLIILSILTFCILLMASMKCCHFIQSSRASQRTLADATKIDNYMKNKTDPENKNKDNIKVDLIVDAKYSEVK